MVGIPEVQNPRVAPKYVLAIDPGVSSGAVLLSVGFRPAILWHAKHVLWTLRDSVPHYNSARHTIDDALNCLKRELVIVDVTTIAGVVEDQYVLFHGGAPVNARSNLGTSRAAGMWIEAWAAATGQSLALIPPGTWQGSEIGGRHKRAELDKICKAKAATLWPEVKLNVHEVSAAFIGRYAAISLAQGRLP